MKYHTQGGFLGEMYLLMVLEAQSLRSRCQQGWFLLRAVKEGSVPGFSPWPVSKSSSSNKDIPQIRLEPILVN